MRQRFILLFVFSMLIGGVVATPAAADRPVEISDSFTFQDVNPCSGLIHEITINLEIRLHEHGDRFVAHIDRTGTTDSGYVMEHGVASVQGNGNILTNNQTDNWRRADGSKFKAQGTFVLDQRTGEVQVDRFSLRCVKA